jgi:hypothetical protein
MKSLFVYANDFSFDVVFADQLHVILIQFETLVERDAGIV